MTRAPSWHRDVEGLHCTREAPVPAVLTREPPQAGLGPIPGGHTAECLFGVCALASSEGTAALQPGMALACVCGEGWGRCSLTSPDLALPLGNYVFSPGSMKAGWLE